jgi:hypothetical protein
MYRVVMLSTGLECILQSWDAFYRDGMLSTGLEYLFTELEYLFTELEYLFTELECILQGWNYLDRVGIPLN